MTAWPRLRLAGRGMLCTGCAKQGWSLAKGSAKARRQCQGKAKSLRSVSSVWSLANGSLETQTNMTAWPRLRLAGRRLMCTGCAKQGWSLANGSAKARRQCQGKAKSLRSISSVWSPENGSLETQKKMTAWPWLRLAGRGMMCKAVQSKAEAWQTAAPRQGGSAKARLSLWEAFQAFEAWKTAVSKPEWCARAVQSKAEAWQTAAPRQGGSAKASKARRWLCQELACPSIHTKGGPRGRPGHGSAGVGGY